MANVTLTSLLSTNPITSPLTGDEPVETVVNAVSEAATIKQLSFAPLNAKTSSYTLTLTDQGKVVTMSNASANNLTIPLNATVAFPIGATLLVRQTGSGATSIVATGGVTIKQRASLTLVLAEKEAQIVLHKIATDTWHTTGEYLAL